MMIKRPFIKWGHFSDLAAIISTKAFFPVYITGLSGNGKTEMAEQACIATDREYIRVQITPETDEDDLIGGFRLVDGNTVYEKGPVIQAMEAGSVLIIDEIDRGSNNIMCLQGILEGKPFRIKKTSEVIVPAFGFTVIATSNTKGRGSSDGRYSAATVIDDSFLERFVLTFEQEFPSLAVENKIVKGHMEYFGIKNDDFATSLCQWAEIVRKTYFAGGIDDLISTRRLCHIVQTFSIFKDEKRAINLCVSKFDEDTKVALLDLYNKLDGSK